MPTAPQDSYGALWVLTVIIILFSLAAVPAIRHSIQHMLKGGLGTKPWPEFPNKEPAETSHEEEPIVDSSYTARAAAEALRTLGTSPEEISKAFKSRNNGA